MFNTEKLQFGQVAREVQTICCICTAELGRFQPEDEAKEIIGPRGCKGSNFFSQVRWSQVAMWGMWRGMMCGYTVMFRLSGTKCRGFIMYSITPEAEVYFSYILERIHEYIRFDTVWHKLEVWYNDCTCKSWLCIELCYNSHYCTKWSHWHS